MTCKNCKHFARGGYFKHTTSIFEPQNGRDLITNADAHTGLCLHPLIQSDHVIGWMDRSPMDTASNGVSATGDDERGYLEVGEDFGCIHFESGECPETIHIDIDLTRKR